MAQAKTPDTYDTIDYSDPDLMTGDKESGVFGGGDRGSIPVAPPDRLIDRDMTVEDILGLNQTTPVTDVSDPTKGKFRIESLATKSNIILAGVIALVLILGKKLGD